MAQEINQRNPLKIVAPQAGFQQRFVRSNADVAFGGGVLNPQPTYSRVLTPFGFVPLSDIQVGETIKGIGKTTQRIVHKDNVGLKDCIRIILDDGSSSESSLDHKWWVEKDGKEFSAISFELLESFQLARDKGEEYNVSIFKAMGARPFPVRIKEIIDIGKRECICIGVSNDDELYITDDYMVTKNCGKAQPLTAKVLTPDGYIYMSQIKEGTVICSPTGDSQTVLKVYDKPSRDIYRMHILGGHTDCCLEHLWYVRDRRTLKFHTLTTEEIIKRGCTNFDVPCNRPIEFSKDRYRTQAPIHPYMMGRIIARGRIDDNIVSKKVMAQLKLMKMDKCFRLSKRYLYGSLDERKELMRGFLDHYTKHAKINPKHGIYVIMPVGLHRDIIHIVQSLGGNAFQIQTKSKNIKLCILLPSFDGCLSALTGGPTPMRQLFRKILSVRKFSREPARCILVSDQSHLYVTNDFIVTHNTYAAILMVAEPTLDPKFRAVFTRRNLANLKAGGGILDDFRDAYGDDYIKITSSENPKIAFPSGSFIDCVHIANEDPNLFMERAKGWQYDCAYMDELTSYEFTTFSILGTRVRGKAKWTGKIRGTTNPKRSHWTRKMLEYYVGVDGFIMPERDGVVRYFYQTMDGSGTVDDLVWGDTKEEVYYQAKESIDHQLKKLGGGPFKWEHLIRSFVFYKGVMAENKASIGDNPSYIGSVAAVGGKRAKQLIEGNFNVDENDDDTRPISSHDAQAVFTNDECRNGDKWITVDLADVGTDNVVALAWDGFHVIDYMIIQSSTPRGNYERIAIFAKQHDIPDTHIIYDGTRATYMHDYMPDALPFISASSAIGMYALMSDRLKDECYLRLVNVIKTGNMSFSESVARSLYVHQGIKQEFTIQTEFLQECAVVRFREKPNGKKKLLSKKEMNQTLGMGRSMDLLDTCAMRMLPCLQFQYGDELNMTSGYRKREQDDGSRSFDIYDFSSWC